MIYFFSFFCTVYIDIYSVISWGVLCVKVFCWMSRKYIFCTKDDLFLFLEFCFVYPGVQFTNASPITINFHGILFIIIKFLTIVSLPIFAHAMTAMLLCSVQKCVVIGSLKFGWQPNEIPVYLNLDGKIINDLDLWSAPFSIYLSHKYFSYIYVVMHHMIHSFSRTIIVVCK